MTTVVVIKRSDGGVSVLHNVPEDADIATLIAKWEQTFNYPGDTVYLPNGTAVPRGTALSWRVMQKDVLPDRTFRDAWCDVTPEPVIDIDIPKAREIQKTKLRAARAPELAKLDVEFMRAVEIDDKFSMQEIAAKKQALRDATKHPDLAAATTPEELKAVTLERVIGI